MNVQAHMSGQISGSVPNQAGTPMPGLPQQNGNALPQLPNLGGHRNTGNMEPELPRARKYMKDKILEFLLQRQNQAHEIPSKRVADIVRRLEEGIFKAAVTKDEYMNLETLESRLLALIKRLPLNNQNEQFSQHVNSSTIGTMIPTPGMSHNGNSNLMVTSSVDSSMIAGSSNAIASTNNNTGPSVGIQGSLYSGYQQSPSNFSISSSGNNMMSSVGVQRANSHMIPTPGFNTNNNQSYTNPEVPSYSGGFSNVESSMLSQGGQQKQHVGGQNSRILRNLGSQMSSGIRSEMQQKAYGFSNGALNGGLGMAGTNLQLVNGSGISEGYLTATQHGNSSKPLQQQFDQHQRPLMQGDVHGMGSLDPSGSGNFCGPASTVGSMMNTQNLNPVNLQAVPKSNFQLIANNAQQAAHVRPQQSMDLSEKMNFSSPLSSTGNLMQSHQQQQFQQQHSQRFQQQQHSQHFQQQQQQFVQHNRQQAQQPLSKNDAFGQSQLTSDLGYQVQPEHVMEHHDEVFHSQVSEQFQLSELQNQFQQNSTGERTSARMLSLPSSQQNVCSSLSQSSQQMPQMLHPHQLVTEPQNGFSSLTVGAQSESAVNGQCNSQSHDMPLMSGSLSNEQQVQEEFRHRITVQDEAQHNHFSSEGSIIGQAVASRGTTEPQSSSGAACRSGLPHRERQFINQQRWLLFMRHARRCAAPEGKCPEAHCIFAQRLWKHLERCNLPHCPQPRCRPTKILLNHYKHCHDSDCPVCVPARNFLKAQYKRRMDSGLPNSINGSCKPHEIGEKAFRLTSMSSPSVIETSDDLQPAVKRIKMEQHFQPLSTETESSAVSVPGILEPHVHHNLQPYEYQHADISRPTKSELAEVKTEDPVNCGQRSIIINEMKKDNIDDLYNQKPDGEPSILHETVDFPEQDSIKLEKDIDQPKSDIVTASAEHASSTKSGKPKIKGVSLTELFTPEQIREHITGLRQWVGQSKAKAEKNQAMEHSMSENSCQLCAVEKLTFEPPPIYCTPCGARIKRNAMYYCVGSGDTRHYFCIPCYNEARGDTITVDGTAVSKARLDKKKNDEETEEWWVQCDKCEAWQHQICALFNGRRNDGGQAEYTCPNCYVAEIEQGERKPLPQSAVLGAKDLPRTILSDHIEQKLFRRLKQERQERARAQGKSFDEVPGAESLVVRVVSSVDKKLDVKQRFLEIFQEENYPLEFPYKSKVVLLFQKIEGVEVCLFGMYVQEFGSECQYPNQRRVYLSYLDSVKYFRPDIKTVTGEALRTVVYHEILIGYLEYCKIRGFTSCYIWACPPLKGEDYILYCHPEIQKTPKSDKLREWYLSMLRKAAKENIVVDLINLYDHFFVSTGECKAKVTAARLPYFDGDYWPGAAEDMIYQLRQEEDGRKGNKKGTTKKAISKRALKASGQSDLSGNASKDLQLMYRLGATIAPMKEDFIMVHLQHACNHCCHLMVSGNRWVCDQCKNFQLCDNCHDIEQKLEEREKHPINQRDKHVLYPIEINDVPADTKDKDETLESEFFDTRQAFLSLCQGNHYQYDTLRRAKHSSMMVLYHLHNPTAPAFVTTCNICHLDIETGQGWRCEICPDYDVCNACYQKDGGIDHPHKLTNHPSIAERDAQNKEARQLRVVQLRKMLDLLVHASQCRSPHCQYSNCRKVKGLFRHGMQCRTRASGGCGLCKKMWYLLQLHARACKESECYVPRCRDLRDHMKRLQQQSDSRRRAAVMEMVRQRGAEVSLPEDESVNMKYESFGEKSS